MFVIERSETDEEVNLRPDEALDILFANCEDAYGFPPYEAIKDFLSTSDSGDLKISRTRNHSSSTIWPKIYFASQEEHELVVQDPEFLSISTLAADFRISIPTASNSRTHPRLRMLALKLSRQEKTEIAPHRRYSDFGGTAGNQIPCTPQGISTSVG